MHEDITAGKKSEEERMRLEQQLLQSQKMDAIGRLAGGIAHDFNNILTAIISYANLMQMMLPADDQTRTYVENMLALANRATTLTQGLLAFSRSQFMDDESGNELERRHALGRSSYHKHQACNAG
jgi:C4-dicarboxylate-specific signal transduction histidine kinase